MPELPEVETIRRSLEPVLVGRVIVEVIIRDRRLRLPVNKKRLQTLLSGRTIFRLERRAKFLLVHLDHDVTLLIHLGMSGRLSYQSSRDPLETHTHVVFVLSDGYELRFRDPRRFGSVEAVNQLEQARSVQWNELGVEPLSDLLTAGYLQQKAGASRRAIKQVLMDNHVVVGVGNIYANESLYVAGLDPRRMASSLSPSDWSGLCEAVRSVLKTAIDKGGTTLNDFRNGLGEIGYFQIDLAVYDREGDPCHRCGDLVERQVIQGRSTYFCPGCQN